MNKQNKTGGWRDDLPVQTSSTMITWVCMCNPRAEEETRGFLEFAGQWLGWTVKFHGQWEAPWNNEVEEKSGQHPPPYAHHCDRASDKKQLWGGRLTLHLVGTESIMGAGSVRGAGLSCAGRDWLILDIRKQRAGNMENGFLFCSPVWDWDGPFTFRASPQLILSREPP